MAIVIDEEKKLRWINIHVCSLHLFTYSFITQADICLFQSTAINIHSIIFTAFVARNFHACVKLFCFTFTEPAYNVLHKEQILQKP